MGSLERDTRLSGGQGQYKGTLSEDWRIWSPNGGYVMSMLLRAAGMESAWPKPLSMMCQFLSAGRFDQVDVAVVSLRKTRVAEALRVSMTQDGKPIAEALIWTGDVVPGYQHDFTQVPDVPNWRDLPTLGELVPDLQHPYPFFGNFEYRPVDFVAFDNPENRPPYQLGWYKFVPEDKSDDAYVIASRYLILLDTFGWTAASQAHRDDPSIMAPTLSLSVDFHDFNQRGDQGGDQCSWLLSDSSGELAKDGIIAVRNRVWAEDRSLLASASGTLICRKRPGY